MRGLVLLKLLIGRRATREPLLVDRGGLFKPPFDGVDPAGKEINAFVDSEEFPRHLLDCMICESKRFLEPADAVSEGDGGVAPVCVGHGF